MAGFVERDGPGAGDPFTVCGHAPESELDAAQVADRGSELTHARLNVRDVQSVDMVFAGVLAGGHDDWRGLVAGPGGRW